MTGSMERRKDLRFPVQFPVEFTILGGDEAMGRRAGLVRDISEGGVRIGTAGHVAPGSFVRMDLEDSVLFGEVKYCCPFVGGYLTGLYVEKVLLGASDLSRLLAAVLKGAVPDRAGVEVART